MHIGLKQFLLAALLVFAVPLSVQAACLGYGSSGQDVIILQQRLRQLHYEISVDGEFGRQTKLAVEHFQQDNGLKKTGFVDNDTWAKLKLAEPHHEDTAYYPIPLRTITNADHIVADAKQYLGVKYVWGGRTPKGFDCSGYVQYIFEKNGVALPRTADLQYEKGLPIKREGLQKGDVVFFTTYTAGPSHNGIYIGDGKFISATTSRGIAIDRLDNSYWKTRYVGAKRMVLDKI